MAIENLFSHLESFQMQREPLAQPEPTAILASYPSSPPHQDLKMPNFSATCLHHGYSRDLGSKGLLLSTPFFQTNESNKPIFGVQGFIQKLEIILLRSMQQGCKLVASLSPEKRDALTCRAARHFLNGVVIKTRLDLPQPRPFC